MAKQRAQRGEPRENFTRMLRYMRGLRRVSRGWLRRPLKTIVSGKGIEIDVWDNYGLTGTAGAPSNPGQAAGSAKDLVDGVTARPKVAAPPIRTNAGGTEAYAFISNLPDNFFGDVFAQISLVGALENILREWEQKLYVDKYNIYRCVYMGDVSGAGYYPTVAIATAEWYLEKFRKDAIGTDLSGEDLKIEFWKNISGQRPKPQVSPTAPPPVRYRTMRQG